MHYPSGYMLREDSPTRAPHHVVLTGATGFVGRFLVLRLLARGYQVTALVRSVDRARQQLGRQGITLVKLSDDEGIERAVQSADTVIHLAGAPVAQRWTTSHKKRMWESRIGLAQRLSRIMQRSCAQLPTIISAGGIGIYGDQGDTLLDENAPTGSGYLAELAVAWEEVWDSLRQAGARVVSLRIGVVLGLEGGFLQKVLPPTEQGLGALLGSGKQYVPWVHMVDLARIIEWSIANKSAQGAYNACAPHPVTHRSLVTSLANQCDRKVFFRVPRWALRVTMGEMASMLCGGQNATPRRALEQGFRFEHPDLVPALREILHGADLRMEAAGEMPTQEPYINDTRPDRELVHQSLLCAPLETVFDFFSKAENLSVLTPPGMGFDIRTPLPIEMHKGRLIDYKISMGPLKFPWRTRIEQWETQSHFVDAQLIGPYASWYHEHRFEAVDEHNTRMTDHVYYRVGLRKIPLGPVGRLIEKRFVRPQLRRIFAYRDRMIQARFGGETSSATTQPEVRPR